MKQLLFSLTTFLLTTIILNAQEDAHIVNNGAGVVPPAPTAANLGKYGDVPINLYTGVPEINIPMYSIIEGNLSVPISLSYHSQGNRVEDIASWVGLGWSLNAGGVITRSVKGVPDDFTALGNDNWWIENSQCNPSDGFLVSGASVESTYNSSASLGYYTQKGYCDSKLDGEPDLFYYNFPGGSGQFMFDNTGAVRFFSQNNYKITYTRSSAGDLNKFEITDGNGNIYTFDQIEISQVNSVASLSYYDTGVLDWWDKNESRRNSYNSSWYLSKIRNSTLNHEINFTYANEKQLITSGFNYDYKYLSTGQAGISEKNFSYITSYIQSKRLTDITWGTGKVSFEANIIRDDVNDGSTYYDLNNVAQTIQSNALTGVIIKDINNVQEKKYVFNTSYYTAPNGTTHANMYKKLKLLSVKEYNNDLSLSNPSYNFEYDEVSTFVPRFSEQQDYWGYLKSNTTWGTPLTYFYPNDAIDSDFLSLFTCYPKTPNGGEVIYNGYDKSCDATAMKAGVLTKIKYPTGGSTIFEYEPHDFYLKSNNRTGGGLRIKKITDFDGTDHTKDIIKNYSYKQSANPLQSSGKIFTLPVYALQRNCYSNSGKYNVTLFSNSIAGLGTTMGSAVGYGEVTVEYNGNGKTINFYNIYGSVGVDADDCDAAGNNCLYNRSHSSAEAYGSGLAQMGSGCATIANTNFPFADNPNYDWRRGTLSEVRVYDNQNKLLQKTVNEYTKNSFPKTYAFTSKLSYYNYVSSADYESNYYVFRFSKHYYLSGWNVLTKQTVTKYDVNNASAIYSTVSYMYYDNALHKQVTKTSIADSKGIIHENVIKRCLDYGTPNYFSSTLNTQNRLNEVIENQSWLSSQGTRTLVGASFTEYKDFATQNGTATSQLLPYKNYNLETATPILESNVTPTTFNSSGFTLDSRFKTATELNFDNKDNLCKNSIYNAGLKNNSCNIFGHSKNLLIAQVSNAVETDCGFTSFESDDQNLWTIGGTTTLINNDGHCGTSSSSIPPNTYGPTRIYTPSVDAQNKKFILSCWVKTNASATGAVGALVLYTMQNPTNNATYPTNGYFSTQVNNTNNVWKYLEVEIDLKQIKLTATPALPLGTNLSISSSVWNNNATTSIQVDDIRFYPKESRMASYTYIPSIGASSVSDENSNCKYYEYDTFGRLKLVKDQYGRILEKTEYNYKP